MNKERIKDLIIKLVLVIIIIILLVHNCYTLKKDKPVKEPTGNVDVIEIKCDKDDTCTSDSKTDNKSDNKPDNKSNDSSDNSNKQNENGNNSDTNDVVEPVSEDEEVIVDDDALIVKDKEITWDGETPAKIFTNSMYELGEKIAPEASNTYQFIVKNGSDYNLKYSINFIEDNPYNINMRYKLKKNDTYIIDHYVKSSELIVTDILLDVDSNDTYYLEWKWVGSSNDTEIGKNPESKYGLKIEVKAESYNG